MNKCRFWLIVLMLGALLVFSVGAAGGTPELKVQKALGVTGTSDVYKIPVGSTITHLPDGSTTITGPDGNLVTSVKSSEVGLIPTPQGMAKATRVYEVPSGSFVHGASSNTIEIYDADGKLILTVTDQAGGAGLEAFQTIPASYEWGWIEYGRSPRRSYSYLYGQWSVPAAPQNSWIDDDVVYLFNGIQGTGANAWAGRQVILQPVVGFNENGWLPGNPLNGRVWVVSSAGSVKTSAIGVSVGNVITGGMSLVDPGQPLWSATIRNRTTGNWASLTTDLLGTTNQFVTCTLEGYNLETDSDLFGTTNFVSLTVRDQNGNTINPSWYEVIDPEALEYFTNLDVIIHDQSRVTLQTAR